MGADAPVVMTYPDQFGDSTDSAVAGPGAGDTTDAPSDPGLDRPKRRGPMSGRADTACTRDATDGPAVVGVVPLVCTAATVVADTRSTSRRTVRVPPR